MKPKRVKSADVTLDVLVRSANPTVVFLHGLAGHHDEWLPVIERLDSSVGVIAPDLRCHGASFEAGQSPDVSRAAFVNDVVTLIDSFAATPVVLVGQSMGGVVATLVAAARPDLVAHLVLIESDMAAMAEEAFGSLQRWFDSWPDRFADDAAATDFFGADQPSTPAWVAGLARTSTGLAPRFDATQLLHLMRTLAAEDRWAQWQEVSTPTTIIRASNGMLADVDIDRMLVARPDAELVVIDDSGHDAHLDQTDRVAAILDAVCSRYRAGD